MAEGVPGRLGRLLSRCKRALQVALDYTRLWDALKNASVVADLDGVILEVGTPLLKAEGVKVVRSIKALSTKPVIVVDTKTVDAAAIEVGLVSAASGDALTVLAVADDAVLKSAVEEAESKGIAVIGDTISHPDPLKAVEKLSKHGVHILLFHVGIDVQRRLGINASEMLKYVEKAVKEFPGPIAVAGGIKPSDAGKFVEAGASIVVIGGAIVRAPDPRAAALEALGAIKPECRS